MVYRRQQCLNNSRAVSPILSSFGKSRHAWIALLILQLPLQATSAAHKETAALWTVTFLDAQDSEQIVDGRVVVEAQDGGLMLEDRMGVLWNITPDRLVDRQAAGREFTAYSSQEVQAALLAEFGASFRCYQAGRYTICTNASRHYALWCGRLLERLCRAFQRYWSHNGLKLQEPGSPLIAIVFRSQQEFSKHATADAGPASADGFGYYSMRSNRIMLFDLTTTSGGQSALNESDLSLRLARMPFNVATVVHEATHQVAFNTGLHTRYADNPLWLTEGMAMYFESMDARNSGAYRTIGRINRWRSEKFGEFVADRRPADSLTTLTANDKRFRNPDLAANAYAEAWALTWFLIRTRRDEYVEFLRHVSRKPTLIPDDTSVRHRDFQEAFGVSPQELNDEFLRFMRRRAR